MSTVNTSRYHLPRYPKLFNRRDDARCAALRMRALHSCVRLCTVDVKRTDRGDFSSSSEISSFHPDDVPLPALLTHGLRACAHGVSIAPGHPRPRGVLAVDAPRWQHLPAARRCHPAARRSGNRGSAGGSCCGRTRLVRHVRSAHCRRPYVSANSLAAASEIALTVGSTTLSSLLRAVSWSIPL